MRHVMKRGTRACGIAAVSSLLKIPYEDVLAEAQRFEQNAEETGLYWQDIIRILNNLDDRHWCCVEIPKPLEFSEHNLLPLDHIIVIQEWDQDLKDYSTRIAHFITTDGVRIFDPDFRTGMVFDKHRHRYNSFHLTYLILPNSY